MSQVSKEEQQSPPDDDALETGGFSPMPTQRPQDFLRQRAERFEFSVLATEESFADEDYGGPHIIRRRQSLKPEGHKTLLEKAKAQARKRSGRHDDPFYDLREDHNVLVLEAEGVKKVRIPSLLECQSYLRNEEAERYKKRAFNPCHMVAELVLNIVAAFFIWFINMINLETIFVVLNAAGAASFFAERKEDWALKLDFAFLAFAVVFPLTFLIQSTFTRREQALSFLADFKSSVLTAALMTLSIDWPNDKGETSGGRLQLAATFNSRVTKDFREFLKLIYEYLSMPQVAHARNHVFWHKQQNTKRVHALQNGIVQDINDYMFDFGMHTEEMKKHGFPAGEASRLHQYHQYMQQRWEHLRRFKYYRTPQATRSYGRVYILLLPWMTGPYWAWMAAGTTEVFAILSSVFTSVVLFGLLTAQQGLEDPFLADYNNLMPGLDTIKLDFELAVMIQAVEQYFGNAELTRAWEMSQQQQHQNSSEELDPVDE